MSKRSLTILLCIGLIVWCQATPTGRVVGGDDAYEGQFPHQISLRSDGRHICGGSIISRRYILTAAHCVGDVDENDDYFVYPASMFTIRAGSNNRLTGGVVRQVIKVTVHEDYNAVILNDVALLELESPLIYSNNIKAIALPKAEVPAGDKVIISGWGRLKTGGDIPIRLQWNTLEAISKNKCLSMIGMFYDALICLNHDKDNGACNGDSGGPAIYNNELVGVAGFVVTGCGSSRPDGYAKVFYHVDWIKTHSDV